MQEAGLLRKRHSPPLFWRVFGINALVFVTGIAALAALPPAFDWPLQPTEAVIFSVGILVLLAANAALLRLGLAPVDRMVAAMATIDLLRPGQRLTGAAPAGFAPLVRAFNDMLARLEAERAASSAYVLSAQEEERRRIARELHDEVGQALTACLLELSQLCDRVPASLRPVTAELLERARASLTDVRRIAEQLRPDVLEQLGLTAALSALVKDFRRSTGLDASFAGDGTTELSEEAELVVYRIAQEGLTNAARHSGAAAVQVRLEADAGGGTRLVIVDDGQGSDLVEGRGIRGMRERALLIGADLQLRSRPGRGTEVCLVVPAGHGRDPGAT